MSKIKIHESEPAWVGTSFDQILANNGTLDELYDQVRLLINREQDPPVST